VSALQENFLPREDVVIGRVSVGAWHELPRLLLGSVGVLGAWLLATIVAPGPNPLGVLVMFVGGAIPAAYLMTTLTDVAMADSGPIPQHAAHAQLRHVGRALIPGGCLALFVAALTLWLQRPSVWLLPSVGLTGAASLLAFLGFGAVTALARVYSGASARRLWVLGGALIASHPLRFASPILIGAAGVWLAVAWTASVLLVIPMAVAYVLALAVWTSASAEKRLVDPLVCATYDH
jgi:hypothetical protein